jgi:hypothetical protein
MVAALAVRLGIAPSVLWEQDPKDLATLIEVITER